MERAGLTPPLRPGDWAFLTQALLARVTALAREVCAFRRFVRLDPVETCDLGLIRLRELVRRGKFTLPTTGWSDARLRRVIVNVAREQRRWAAQRPGTVRLSDSEEDHSTIDEFESETLNKADDDESLGVAREGRLDAMVAALRPAPTGTQLEVLRMRMQGLSTRRIAVLLGICARSVRDRLARLLTRLKGQGGVASAVRSIPPVSAEFFVGRPPRWRPIYVALLAGRPRVQICKEYGLSKPALAALLRRMRVAAQVGSA
jgi:DNA-binding CsgD family transcriptional regulator